jgi:hypothetical protein
MKKKLNNAWKWLRKNVFCKEMILWVLVAEAIFWLPAIFGIIMAMLVNSWWWTIVAGYVIFWAGPITPAMALQFGLALLLKKLFKRKKKVITGDSGYSRCSERPYSASEDEDTFA